MLAHLANGDGAAIAADRVIVTIIGEAATDVDGTALRRQGRIMRMEFRGAAHRREGEAGISQATDITIQTVGELAEGGRVVPGAGADIDIAGAARATDIDLAPTIFHMVYLASIEVEDRSVIRTRIGGVDLHATAGAIGLQRDGAGTGEVAADGQVIGSEADIAARAGSDGAGGNRIARTRYRHVHRFARSGGNGWQRQRVHAGQRHIADRRRATPGPIEGDAVRRAGNVGTTVISTAERQGTSAGIQRKAARTARRAGFNNPAGDIDIAAAGIDGGSGTAIARRQARCSEAAAIGGHGRTVAVQLVTDRHRSAVGRDIIGKVEVAGGRKRGAVGHRQRSP